MKSVLQGFNKKSKSFKNVNNQFLFYLDDVSVRFDKVRALENITLTINQGEILFVTGKSGAGKTTLLNLLGGDITETKGKIYRPDSSTVFVSQVFQDLKLFTNQTCEENLWYSYDKSIYKSKKDFYEDMMELVKILGVEKSLSKKITEVNGGMKQKICLMRALLAKPNVLLADEPTSSLDKESSIKLFEVLNYYNLKRGLTVIWASHNRDLVKQFPGKIIHIENGKLIYSGHACFI